MPKPKKKKKRLPKNLRQWEKITDDPFVAQMLENTKQHVEKNGPIDIGMGPFELFKPPK